MWAVLQQGGHLIAFESCKFSKVKAKVNYNIYKEELLAVIHVLQTSDKDEDLKVEYFRFAPDIAKHLSSASLVISHAGSGSIFETLHCLKPLVVVVNEALMDNHQFELAEELARKKHLYCATPKTLVQTLKNMDLESLVPYKAGDAKKLVRSLNHFLGFED